MRITPPNGSYSRGANTPAHPAITAACVRALRSQRQVEAGDRSLEQSYRGANNGRAPRCRRSRCHQH